MVAILRLLEERTVERAGRSEPARVDVRIVASTNRALLEEVNARRFREELYYRLSAFPLIVPPLRSRPEDIPALAAGLLEEICRDQGKAPKGISAAAMGRFAGYFWPGNVRELRNVLERLAILSRGRRVEEEAVRGVLGREPVFPAPPPAPFPIGDFRKATLAFEKEYLARKLRENSGNVSRTARKLGLDRTSIHRKMKLLGISVDSARR
jgi:two-component system nitrogen regulation response regulator NtrX